MMFSRAPFFFREEVQGIKTNLFIHVIAVVTISFSLLTLGIYNSLDSGLDIAGMTAFNHE